MALVALLISALATGAVAMLQSRALSELSEGASREAFCAPVRDAGAMGLIEVEVGSSAQKLNLVVDTGSNVLIVESCECQLADACFAAESCFNRNMSDTFSEVNLPNGSVRELVLNFGSGVIGGVVAREKVRFGTARPVDMKDGMLFMTDRKLDFEDNFEGILGLGPPQYLVQEAIDSAKHAVEDELRDLKKAIQNASAEEKEVIAGAEAQMKAQENDAMPEPLGFLEQAGFHRFSLCFGKGDDSNGTLVVGGEPAAHRLKSIGKMHWGLAVEGVAVDGKPVSVSVAEEAENGFAEILKAALSMAPVVQGRGENETAAAVSIPGAYVEAQQHQQQRQQSQPKPHACSRDSMKAGQETPCGAVPDSGTTTLAMPQNHLDAIADSICDSWGRCASNYTKLQEAAKAAGAAATRVYGLNPFDLPEYSKADVLSFVLSDCHNFGQDIADVMAELPDIQVRVSDTTSHNTVELAIPAASYVFQVDMSEELTVADPAGPSMGCMLGLSAIEYETEKTGPVWILGKPLFHEYKVTYDLQDNTVGFQHTDVEPCGVCRRGNHLGLLTSIANVTTRPQVSSRHRAPLKVLRKHLRKPHFDTSKPF